MPKLSVARAFDRTLLPKLTDDGFDRLEPRRFGRIRGDVFQHLSYSVDGRMSSYRSYRIEFGSMLLVEPHSFPTITIGGCFPDGNLGSDYRAVSEESLAASVERAARDYDATWRAVITRTETVEGIADWARTGLASDTWVDLPSQLLFTLASAEARLGKLSEALQHAEASSLAHEEEERERGEGFAGTQGPIAARTLAAAIRDGNVASLQDAWRRSSIEALAVEALDEHR